MQITAITAEEAKGDHPDLIQNLEQESLPLEGHTFEDVWELFMLENKDILTII